MAAREKQTTSLRRRRCEEPHIVDQTGNDVNVSPIAFNDSYKAIGNTLLEVGCSRHVSSAAQMGRCGARTML